MDNDVRKEAQALADIVDTLDPNANWLALEFTLGDVPYIVFLARGKRFEDTKTTLDSLTSTWKDDE